MKQLNKYISFFFAAVIAFGVTVSTLHVHDSANHNEKTEHVLVEEELTCVVCGSIFKYNSTGEIYSGLLILPETFFFDTSFERASYPIGKFKDGRAPPSIG
ncbi:MAG: hypothetical protein EA390_02875 [Balneolaceae bacterium]|nr:MAG: hypothetical protein EA390_02875 [Balneolaceae bacterium]